MEDNKSLTWRGKQGFSNLDDLSINKALIYNMLRTAYRTPVASKAKRLISNLKQRGFVTVANPKIQGAMRLAQRNLTPEGADIGKGVKVRVATLARKVGRKMRPHAVDIASNISLPRKGNSHERNS